MKINSEYRNVKDILADTFSPSLYRHIPELSSDISNPKYIPVLGMRSNSVILDGVCSCKRFIRVQNKVWKSWLFKLDTEHRFKGLEDKLRIQKCLELVGFILGKFT